jgi:FAD/FMN-containing dehydrogenase
VVAALLALSSVDQAVELSSEIRLAVPGLQALELMEGDSFRLAASHLGRPVPVRPDAAAYLLVEVTGMDDPTETLAAVASAVTDEVAAADSTADRERLWAFREAHSETAAALASERGRVVHKMDVTLPAASIAHFCDEVRVRIDDGWPGSVTLLYGHVGDGNIHVNVVGPEPDDDTVDDVVFGLVLEHGGSISAEHGIGVAKKRWLPRDRSPAEVAAMRAIKSALDPDNILNPSVLF